MTQAGDGGGGKEEAQQQKKKVSVDKSNSEYLQVSVPPQTGHAACLAWPAILYRLFGMGRFSAPR